MNCLSYEQDWVYCRQTLNIIETRKREMNRTTFIALINVSKIIKK